MLDDDSATQSEPIYGSQLGTRSYGAGPVSVLDGGIVKGATVYLERHEDENNIHRFYAVEIVRDLFGAWILIRRWGRVGTGQGQCLIRTFETVGKARADAVATSQAKQQRGYQIIASRHQTKCL
ncbi:WGR domain-containing protein [Shimia abyssi]|uniref:WGR domain-containing protein n=1 Tax=Shimia abyssi TaxID=1662395 RepID=UPI003C6F0CFF